MAGHLMALQRTKTARMPMSQNVQLTTSSTKTRSTDLTRSMDKRATTTIFTTYSDFICHWQNVRNFRSYFQTKCKVNFEPIFEQNVTINFEANFKQNANFDPIFEQNASINSEPIFEKSVNFELIFKKKV